MSKSKASSFVENVNFVANATKAATGDIVEDARIAADEAEYSAGEANKSANEAKYSERLSHKWAVNPYNVPIDGTTEFSSYHWSVVSRNNAGDGIVQDGVISTKYTWSSSHINTLLNDKSDKAHNHDNVYEKLIVKNTAFNKNFAGNGSSSDVSRSDHNHDGIYENVIGTKNTAFNKNFGEGLNDVARGSHNHDSKYMPLATINTAYNKNFGTEADTVAVGNHVHPASAISYDNTNANIITSATTQGALSQLDSQLGILSVSDNTYITAGLSTQYEQTIAGIDTPVRVTVPLAVLNARNASITNGSSIHVSITPEPTKLIEGFFSVSLTYSGTDNIALSMAIDGTISGERTVSDNGVLTITKYLSGLSNTGFELSVWISNLSNTNNIFIESMNIAWEGKPQGALVASGTSVDHSDLTGTGAANGVHTIDDIQDLPATLAGKIDRPSTFTDNNYVLFDSSGNLKDSGKSLGSIDAKIDKVVSAAELNIPIFDNVGGLVDSGKNVDSFALVNGDNSEVFNVADSSPATNNAVPRTQLDSMLTSYAQSSDLTNHESASNPHMITPSLINAAESVHIHTINDVTGLSDEFDTKYTIVPAQPTGNIPKFDDDAGSPKLSDSGIAYNNIFLKTDTHNTIQGRDAADAHPLSSITGLTDTGAGDKYLSDDGQYKTVVTGSTWGSITGTLSDQTDLSDELDTKVINNNGFLPVTHITTLTQAQYDSATLDSTTLYIIVG